MYRIVFFVVAIAGPFGLASAKSVASGAIPKDAFCQRLLGSLERHLAGLDTAREQLGLQLRGSLVQAMQGQNIPPYFELAARDARTQRFVSSASIIATSLGAPPSAVLLHDFNELRFLPFAQEHKSVIAVSGSFAPLTPGRVRALIATARRRNIRLFIVWSNAISMTIEQSQVAMLSHLASATGGVLALANGPCQDIATM